MASGPNRTLKLSYVGDSSKFNKTTQEVEGRLSKLGGGFAKFGKVAAAGAAAAGAAVAAAAVGVFKAAESVAGANDKILKSSLKVGAASDRYQELQYWAGQNGVESDNLSRALGRLNQRMAKADDETKGYGKAFADLGVQVKDTNGELRTSDEVFADTVASLRAIESPAARSAKAAEVFGTKLARDLMPALDDTSLGIEEAAQRAQELGLIIDQEALEASARFGDALADVRDSVTALKNRALAPVIEFFADNVLPMIIDKVIPAVLELADKIGPHIQKFIEVTVEKFAAFVKFAQDRIIPIVRDLFERLSDLVERFREWSTRVFPGVRDSFKRLREPIAELWENIKEAWGQVRQLIDAFRQGESDGQGFQRFIDGLVNVIGLLIRGLNIAIRLMNRFRDILIRIVESKAFQSLLSGIGAIGGAVSRGIGRIAGLAEGGIVTKPTLAMVGEGGEPEAVIPLSKMGQMGGGGVNITINGAIDPEATARQIRRILEDSERRTGARLNYAA
jgi:hypothetical protein